MGYGSAMRDITDGSAIEWTADPANRCGAEYNVINKKNFIEYTAYVCICTLCRDCTVLYIRVCIPDISKYGVCITDEYLHTRHQSRAISTILLTGHFSESRLPGLACTITSL